MAEKPLNINNHARLIAAQQAGQAQVEVSFESVSVELEAAEPINVEGVAYVFAYGGGAVSCMDTPGGTPVALEDRAGAAVVVTTARLVETRGVRYISFADASVVVFTG